MYNIEVYTTDGGNAPFKKFLSKLSKSGNDHEITQIENAINMLSLFGRDTNIYVKNLVKPLGDGLFELRPGPHRVLYFYFDGETIVILHAFRKDSQKTRNHQIRQARQEMDDYIGRHCNERETNIQSDDGGNKKRG